MRYADVSMSLCITLNCATPPRRIAWRTTSPSLSAADIITTSVIVIVVAGLASLQPAWKASRMDPITALRHV